MVPGPKSCPKGQILRRGYIRTNSKTNKKIYIGAKCIKDKGNKGKSKFVVLLKKGVLGKHGYHNIKNISAIKRHRALASAIREYGPLSIMRKINILAIMNKNREELSKIYLNDKAWIYKYYEVKMNGRKK